MSNLVTSIGQAEPPLPRAYGGLIAAQDELPIHGEGDYYEIEGSATISRLPAMTPGHMVSAIVVSGAPVLAHSTTALVVQGAANVTLAAGDEVDFFSMGDGIWRAYVARADGSANGSSISALTEDTAPDIAADFLMSFDASAAGNKKLNPTVLIASAIGAQVGMINGTIVESHAGNAATFAIKTLAGNDPSATDPVYAIFRNATAGTGNFVIRRITAALALTISSGSTLGTSSASAFRIHLLLIDNAGTVLLGAVRATSGSGVMALHEDLLISTTAEGGAGGADSNQVIYASSAVSGKAFRFAAYAEYGSGLTTAGTWDASPTKLQLHGPGVPKPGDVVQIGRSVDGTVATGTTTLPADDTTPQNTEGDEYISRTFIPSSAANLLDVDAQLFLANNQANQAIVAALFRDSGANALASSRVSVASASFVSAHNIRYRTLAASTSTTSFKIRGGSQSAGTTTFNGAAGGGIYNGTLNTFIEVREIFT